jgi:hypothetical protein
MTTMFQCDLSHGTTHQRAYIEERGAKIGNRIKLKDSDDPSIYWTVDSVASKGIDKDYLETLKVAYRKQREASDI